MSLLSTNAVECPAYLLAQARNCPPTLTAVVNAGTEVAMQSAMLATHEGLIEPVLVGDSKQIRALANTLDWDISAFRVEAAESEVTAAQISVSLAKHGEVASLMKGNVHTDDLLRAVLNKEEGLRTNTRLSHVFHMSVPHTQQSLCISDAVINVLPSVDVKLDIARNATTLLHALGNACPKIAVLSASEVVSTAMPSSVEAAEVVQRAENGELSGAILGGPFAFDNAVSTTAAKLKGIEHEVAGRADLLLVPNIETGNALFKQMVYFMGAAAAGLVLGATVPIILTSRADPSQARLAAAAIASIYANYQSNR